MEFNETGAKYLVVYRRVWSSYAHTRIGWWAQRRSDGPKAFGRTRPEALRKLEKLEATPDVPRARR